MNTKSLLKRTLLLSVAILLIPLGTFALGKGIREGTGESIYYSIIGIAIGVVILYHQLKEFFGLIQKTLLLLNLLTNLESLSNRISSLENTSRKFDVQMLKFNIERLERKLRRDIESAKQKN
jgi:hypothetical protein